MADSEYGKILVLEDGEHSRWVPAEDVWREIVELERAGKPVTIRTITGVDFVPFDDPKEWAKYAPEGPPLETGPKPLTRGEWLTIIAVSLLVVALVTSAVGLW